LADRVRERDILMTWTLPALEAIVKNSYDPANGARPIQRYIQRQVEGMLSRLILEGSALAGSSLQLDYGPQGFLFLRPEIKKELP